MFGLQTKRAIYLTKANHMLNRLVTSLSQHKKVGATTHFLRLLIFFENCYDACYIFFVSSPVSKTFAFLRTHYAIYRYMFTVGFQCNFRQITTRLPAGRCQYLFSYMLLFWCSWFKYKFIKTDLVTVGKF